MEKQKYYFVTLPKQIKKKDLEGYHIYPKCVFKNRLYFDSKLYALSCVDAFSNILIRKGIEDIENGYYDVGSTNELPCTITTTDIHTDNDCKQLKHDEQEKQELPLKIRYKYIKFIIQAITYVEWILSVAVLIDIFTFAANTSKIFGEVVSVIIVILIGLVIILFAITIGKVYLKNQYNNK